MGRLHQTLDPTQTGQAAETLHSDLRRRIVGQDQAISEIVNIYQMYLAGLNAPAGQLVISCFSDRQGRARRGSSKPLPKACWAMPVP